MPKYLVLDNINSIKMARPNKQGIDYFPMDVRLDDDDKLAMIIGDFGYKGELIFIKLISWIYANQGYYAEWTEMEQLKFAKRVAYIGGSPVNLIKEVVAGCIKWGLFDQTVFESFNILTSRRIQKTWLDATRLRKDRVINSKIWLNEVNNVCTTIETELITLETTQSKVNKSIVKESIKEPNGSVAAAAIEVEKAGKPEKAEEELALKDLKRLYADTPKNKEAIIYFVQRHRPNFIEPYILLWNIWATDRNKPKVEAITDKRKSHFNARIKEKEFDFLEIMKRANKSTYLLEGTWFTFDWFTKSKDNYIKILEGNYDNEKGKPKIPDVPVNAADEKLERLINKSMTNGNTAV